MGDRVQIQVIDSKSGGFSPVVYGHWCGDRTPAIIANLRRRMIGRESDVPYTAARLVQEMIGTDDGNLSFGIWNAPGVLTAADSPGDAGVVLIDVATPAMKCKCLGGYLKASMLNRKPKVDVCSCGCGATKPHGTPSH